MASLVARFSKNLSKGYLPRPNPKTPPDYGSLIKDPAIERWNSMRETTTKHIKWTPKTISLAFFWAGVVPSTMYYFVKQDIENQYRAAGKKVPNFFPAPYLSDRRPDPLPPRKEGVKISL